MGLVGLDKLSEPMQNLLFNTEIYYWKVEVNQQSIGWHIKCSGYQAMPVVTVWRVAKLATEYATKMLNIEFAYEINETHIEVYAKGES